MTRRLAAAAALAVVAVSVLSGCVTTSRTCVSWVDFADAQAMYDEAVLVVAGTADPAEGQIELLSGPGDLHRVVVDEVYKGELDGDEFWAASPRDYCVAEPPQPAEDPIPAGERVLLFLRSASAYVPGDGTGEKVMAWSTLTPGAGALPFEDGAEPPFDTVG